MAYPRSPTPPLEAFPALDIRQLRRAGKLQVGHSSIISWARDGEREPCASIQMAADDDAITLTFQTVEDGALVHQRIPLEYTAQALGGRRAWFTCNVVANGRHCGRRVAVLYVTRNPVFACRRCHDLSYASQREALGHRGIQRARKIRLTAGGGPNVLEAFPRRPANMRREVYAALRARYDRAMARLERNARRSLSLGGLLG
jgi:hypothetical protein